MSGSSNTEAANAFSTASLTSDFLHSSHLCFALVMHLLAVHTGLSQLHS
jgi:hypothetical protein